MPTCSSPDFLASLSRRCGPVDSKKIGVDDHAESHLFPDIVQHIRMNEPRLFFLENVVGWALTSRLDGGDSWMARHMAMLDDLGKYETTVLKLDLLPWADARRERFYVVGCHRDMCPTSQAWAEFERLVDDARGRAAPEDITKSSASATHCMPRSFGGSATGSAWRDDVMEPAIYGVRW